MKLHPIFCAIISCALAAPAASQGQTIEEIVVTGSLIRGTPQDAAMPVDTITADDLDRQGAPPPLEMLKNLSYMNGIVGESNNFTSGRGQAAHGTASINLRGLGAGRTLVLLNGKRMAAQDANRLPANAIARVEVLKDGGAVTYGSDAIAGVVNYITKDSQDGFEVRADYRAIEKSDGDYNIGISWGTSTEKSDVFASLNYYHRSELPLSDVGYAIQPYTKNPEGGWLSGGNPGAFATSDFGGPYLDPGCEDLGGIPTNSAGQHVSMADATSCTTRYTNWYNLVDEQDSYQAFASYRLALDADTDLKIEALYSSTDVDHASSAGSYPTTNFVPGELTSHLPFPMTGQPGAMNPYYILGANNPYNIFGMDIPVILNQWAPYSAGGNPAFGGDGAWTEYHRELYRISVDLNGKLTDNIGYRSSLSYSKSEDERREWDIRIDKLQAALLGEGGPDRNLALNPFTSGMPYVPGIGENPYFNPATNLEEQRLLAQWLMEQHRSTSIDELIEFNFVLDGELPVVLSGGAISWAAGVQYRHEVAKDDFSNLSDQSLRPCPNFTDTTCSENVRGASPWAFLATYVPYDLDREVKAVFGELMIPITDTFTAQLAARYEDYGNVGGDSFDPNLRLRWQVTDWLALRASAGTTFRAPSQSSLRTATSTGFAPINQKSTPIHSRGNPNLKPEEATNYNIGLIFSGANFEATIDYWRYEIDRVLGTEPRTGMVEAFWRGGNPDCDSPLRDRFDITPNCNDPNASITGVYVNQINGGEIVNDGIDIQGSYTWDAIGPGALTVGGAATWINQYKSQDIMVEGVLVEKGFDGVGRFNLGTSLFPLPEWRGNLFLDYGMSRQSIRWTMNYIDSYKDTRDIFGWAKAGQTIDSHVTHNLTYRLDVSEQLTISAVVDNVTDEDPPFVRTEMNYDPVTHNPLTRTFKLGAQLRF